MRSFVPRTRSEAWLQRGWGTRGLTLAQKPYSFGPEISQNVFGRSSVKAILTIDFTLLKPYFQGVVNLSGAPFDFWIGLPKAPVDMNDSSFIASAIVSPST